MGVWNELKRTNVYESGVNYLVGREKDSLRIQLFEAFLLSVAYENDVREQAVAKVVFKERTLSQRHQLYSYLNDAIGTLMELPTSDKLLEEAIEKSQATHVSLRDTPTSVNSAVKAPPPAKSTPRPKVAAVTMDRRRFAFKSGASAVQYALSHQKLTTARRE